MALPAKISTLRVSAIVIKCVVDEEKSRGRGRGRLPVQHPVVVVGIRMLAIVLVNNVVTETGDLVPEICQQLRPQDEDLSVTSFLVRKKEG